MDALIGILMAIYWAGVFGYGFFAWLKYTNRSQSDIERRARAMGHGLAWPYFAYKHFASEDQRMTQQQELKKAEDRILGG